MSKLTLDDVQSPVPAVLIGPAASHRRRSDCRPGRAAYNSFLVVLTDERQRLGR